MGLTTAQRAAIVVGVLGLLVAGALFLAIPVSTADGSCGTPAEPDYGTFMDSTYESCPSALDSRGATAAVVAGIALMGGVLGLMVLGDRSGSAPHSPTEATDHG